jgi:hypothetical protein
MARFDYHRYLDIGNQVAESDGLLNGHFVAIGANEYVGKQKPAIILGRKGAGKTALRLHFERIRSPTKRSISIEPSYTDLEGVFEYIVHKEQRTFSNEFISVLWEITTLLNLARIVWHESPPSETPPELAKLHSTIDDIKRNERYGVGRTLDLIALHFPSDEKRAALLRALKSYVRRVIADNDLEYYVLIDSIDDVLHSTLDTTKRNDLFATFFEGLWSFFRGFSNQSRNGLASRVFVHVFVPFDLYNWTISRHADHLRQYKHQVSWEREQLEEFITSRLVYNLTGTMQKQLERQSDEVRRDNIWQTFFPKYISTQTFADSGPFTYRAEVKKVMIDMTLRRPRDLQEIIRQVYERTKDSRKRFPDERSILEAFDQYSVELRQSVEKEYELVFPKMNEVLTRFAGNFPTIEKNTLIDLVGKVVGHDESSIYKAVLILFEACVIGASKTDSGGKKTVMFYYHFQDFLQLWGPTTRFGFHPAFWHSLQLASARTGRVYI